MDLEENTVTLSLGDFLAMRDNAIAFNELLNIIFKDCSLSWDDNLAYNDKDINGYLKYAAPDMYKKKLDALKAEKEKEE